MPHIGDVDPKERHQNRARETRFSRSLIPPSSSRWCQRQGPCELRPRREGSGSTPDPLSNAPNARVARRVSHAKSTPENSEEVEADADGAFAITAPTPGATCCGSACLDTRHTSRSWHSSPGKRCRGRSCSWGGSWIRRRSATQIAAVILGTTCRKPRSRASLRVDRAGESWPETTGARRPSGRKVGPSEDLSPRLANDLGLSVEELPPHRVVHLRVHLRFLCGEDLHRIAAAIPCSSAYRLTPRDPPSKE